PQIADPPPATCTIRPDDRPDRSCRSAGVDKESDAADRLYSCQTPQHFQLQAPQKKVCRPRENTIRVSWPRAAARHQIAPTCRSRFETAPPLFAAAFPCSSASKRTTAPRFSAENTAP